MRVTVIAVAALLLAIFIGCGDNSHSSPTKKNQPPAVNAGSDQIITLFGIADLDGTVTDDGLPNPPNTVTTTWSMVSGPGTVTLGNASATDTTAIFSAAGTYVLRLTANDSVLSASDDVSITVNQVTGNQPPAVNAGSDQIITLPGSANLDGTINDDGLPNPPGTVTLTWSMVSGPGTVTFGNASAVDTTAAFSTNGTYVLRLTANDSVLSASDNVTVTGIGAPVSWQAIACGDEHTLAIKTDGSLWAWGNNEDGQLGIGTTTDSLSPVRVGIETNWQAIACGGLHTLAIKADGALWAWGFNMFGQLGIGTTTGSLSPVRVGTETNWQAIACGGLHTLAIKTNGTLWACGDNMSGQLGIGTTPGSLSPVQVGIETNWQAIACGGGYTLAIKTNGTLWACGDNEFGQFRFPDPCGVD